MRVPVKLVLLVVALLAAIVTPAAGAPSWYRLGSSESPVNHDPAPNGADAILPSITDLGGKPHVAWLEADTVWAARLDGIHIANRPWTELGGSVGTTSATGYKPSLAVIGGEPWVAWIKPDGTNLEVRVARFTAGAWQEVVGGASPINISTSLDADAPTLTSVGGRAHVAWAENDGTGTYKVHVKRLNIGLTAWDELGSGPGLIGSGSSADIASVGGVPVPYVAYSLVGGPNVEVVVKKYNSATNAWDPVGTAGSISNYGDNGLEPDITELSGVPWVTWYEALTSGGADQIRVKSFNGSSWVQPVAGDDSLNHVPGTHARNPSIANVGGMIHVAWQEDSDQQVRAARLNGSSWEELGDGFSRNAFRSASSPDLTSSGGLPVVAWYELDEQPGDSESGPNPNSNRQIYVAAYGEPPAYEPQNTSPPVMSGVPQPGNMLTCAPGTWTGATEALAHQFVRSVGGGPFNPINGSDSTTYTVTNADLGARVACRETATNSVGPASALSNFKTASTGGPGNVTRPVITGTPVTGQTLSCTDGAWDNAALSYTRRWLRDGDPVPGATGVEFTLRSFDFDVRMTCEVTAQNDVGPSAPATSDSVYAVREVPAPFSNPGLNVVAKEGPATATNKRLECRNGTWAHDPDEAAHSFRVERAGGGVAAHGRTYDVTLDDLGRSFVCVEIVTNAKGSGEARSPETVVPLPLEELSGSVKMYKAGGFNRFDPVNLMVTPEGLSAALAPAQLARVQKAYAEFTAFCATLRLTDGVPSKLPSLQLDERTRNRELCRLLLNSPPDQIKVFSNGVHVIADPSKCILGDQDPCAALPIPMPPAEQTNQPVHPDLLPERVLWDLDGNGTVDISCPGNAPIARTIYSAGWWKVRGIIVLPGSEETGIYPSITEYFDHHSPLPPPPDKSEFTYQPEPFNPANIINPAINQGFQVNFKKNVREAATPPSGIKPGKLRKAQPMWCWNKIDPPEIKEQPCTPKGTIGAITVEGNICPVSLRRIPDDELAALERSDPELYKILVVQNFALGAARAARLRERPQPIHKADIIEYTPKVSYDLALQEMSAWEPQTLDLSPRVVEVFRKNKVDITKASGILDQTAIIHGPAKIDGVLVDAPRTLVLPSDVGDVVDSVKKMRLFASQAIPSVGGLPVGDPTKPLNAAIDDAVDAGAQALIKEFDLDKLKDSGLAKVQELSKNLNLGPFKLAGDVDVKLENGAAKIDAWAELPLLNKARARVQLRATPDGKIQFEGVSFSLKSAKLGALDLKDVFVEYVPATGLLIKGKITFSWAGGAGIEIVEFRVDNKGELTALGLNYLAPAGLGINIGPGVFLIKIGATIRNTKEAQEFQADAGISMGPSLGDGCASVGVDGTLVVHFGPPPFNLNGHMSVQLVCLGLANVDFAVWPQLGTAHIVATMGFEGGPLFFNGKLTGDIKIPNWQVRLDVEGGVRLPDPLPDIKGSLHGIMSNRGLAACGTVPIVDITGGAGVTWSPELLLGPIGILSNVRIFEGCDFGPYTTIRSSSLRRAQSGGQTFNVAKGEKALVLSVEGLGAAPKTVLRGPDGTVLDLTGDAAGVTTDRAIAARVEDEDRDVFLVKAPAAGDWTLETAPDSVQVVRLKRSQMLPKPKVTAKVVRKGPAYELRWSVAKQKGQVVRFMEQAEGATQTLVTVKDGGSGVKRFMPGESTKASRVIVAEVEQNVLPRANMDVLKFSAASPRVGKPGKLRVRRSGKGALITWGPAFFADRYEVTVTTTTGERSLFTATKGKRQIKIKRLATRDSLTARVVGVSPGGKPGPAGTAKLSAQKAKRK